jgi:hypothetical protein
MTARTRDRRHDTPSYDELREALAAARGESTQCRLGTWAERVATLRELRDRRNLWHNAEAHALRDEIDNYLRSVNA